MSDEIAKPSFFVRAVARRNVLTLWLPLCLTFATIVLFVVAPRGLAYAWLGNTISIVFLSCLAYFLLLMLLRLIQRRWSSAIAALVCLIASLVAVVPAIALVIASMALGPSEDGFADNLEIPEDIVLEDPLKWPPKDVTNIDLFQDAVLQSLESAGDGNEAITIDCQNLLQVRRNSPEILERYLATHPAWRVFRERGVRYATRRWAIESAWRYSMHGYFTDRSIRKWPGPEGPKFQSRTTIGLDGVAWRRNWWDSSKIKHGDTVKPALKTGNGMPQSHIVIEVDDIVVELFEQSSDSERRITKTALKFIDSKLKELVDIQDWEDAKSTIDAAFTRRGAAVFDIYESFQPGIYDSYIWVNPGEPGMVYLKAFEITQDYQLSTNRLPERSNEWIGWSEDPDELFFSNTHFTIYEGDWDQPYAARFELWFVPDSGGPERKLIEKEFKIEGWMR